MKREPNYSADHRAGFCGALAAAADSFKLSASVAMANARKCYNISDKFPTLVK
jgi:hypothetical protein